MTKSSMVFFVTLRKKLNKFHRRHVIYIHVGGDCTPSNQKLPHQRNMDICLYRRGSWHAIREECQKIPLGRRTR